MNGRSSDTGLSPLLQREASGQGVPRSSGYHRNAAAILNKEALPFIWPKQAVPRSRRLCVPAFPGAWIQKGSRPMPGSAALVQGSLRSRQPARFPG
jgi:hypothetical protein